MKEKFKKILLINLIFLVYSLNLYSDELIVPQKKPIISDILLKKNHASNYLIPQIKPKLVSEEEDNKSATNKKKEVNKKVDGFVLPQSKPLIVKKYKAIVKKKSKYLLPQNHIKKRPYQVFPITMMILISI